MFNVSETNANRALGTGQAEHQVMSQTIDAIISHAGSGFRDLGMAKSKQHLENRRSSPVVGEI
jgi:hypothetical protein